MTNSAWKTPHFFACYAKRSAETGKCSPTSDCCPVFLTSSPFPSFVKIISSIPRRKGGKGTVLGDREVYIKYRRKLIATKCSTFEMIFLTQRHRSRAISEKCNKILHKIILSLSLWAINASPFGERQLSERRQSYE